MDSALTYKAATAAGRGPRTSARVKIMEAQKNGALSLIIFLAAAPLLAAGSQETQNFVEEVFLTEEGALKAVFPPGTATVKETLRINDQERKRIEARLGWTLQENAIVLYKGSKGGAEQGYAVITEEIGKFKPITFMVKTSPDGKVDQVEVMVYREAVGSDVRRPRFTRQFKNKTAKDRLRINRDILNISGATMSVQAMTAGVKKVLVILDELVIHPQGSSK